jgi:polar amino acid transport system permease protein
MKYRFDFGALVDYWPAFLHGTAVTLAMTVVSTVLGLAIGVLCATARGSKTAWIRRASGTYVEVVRNTPFLIQIFILFFGLSSLGIRLPVFVAAVLAMVINVGAYTAEIVRAGIDSVSKGQIEAAQALALRPFQIFWLIVLRPALERVYPSLTSQFTLMMLSSSVTSQISAEELTAIANTVQSDTFRSFETYIVVAVLYLLLTLLLKSSFWGLGLWLFPRRRLGIPA